MDFWTLFENGEHRYTAQYLKAGAETAIKAKITALAGSQVHKTKGGYAFDLGSGNRIMTN